MISNENLKKQNYYYQETKNLFATERAKAKKHLHYAHLRLKFLDWLERGYMDELVFKFETEKFDITNLDETMAWQEAVFMFGDEVKEDGFYVDIVGGTNNYAITFSYSAPKTKEEEKEFKDLMKKVKAEHFNDKLAFKEREKLNNFFHSLMGLKTKESPISHSRHEAFNQMVNACAKQGDTYQQVIAKLSKSVKGKKAPLEVFLATKQTKKVKD